jgi:hypothetical protein
MKEKCCKNCLFFIDNNNTKREFACHLHGSEASITWPEDQFCGDENWISVKVKTRIENLEKLGI